MGKRRKLTGLRLGFTYGAGLVLLALVVAMISVQVRAATPATVSARPAADALPAAPNLPIAREPVASARSNMAPRMLPAVRIARRTFVFTPVPGHALPALGLPPAAARALFIAAHADGAVLVSAPPRQAGLAPPRQAGFAPPR